MLEARIKPISLTLALCASGPAMLAPPVLAADIHEQVTVTPDKTVTPQEEAVISSAGVKVLRHITQARAHIRDKDSKGARAELDQARKLLEIIRVALPTSRIKDRISVAKKHLQYASTQEVLPDLIPIYASLDELIQIMPTEDAKRHLDEARDYLKSGDKDKARKALEATAGALRYTEVDLPLGTTRRLVTQAIRDLEQQKPAEADKALQAADKSVIFMSVTLHQPLLKARTLLWQTLLELRAGNRDAAQSDLKTAIACLEAAGKSRDKATREAAEQALVQAGRLQSDLEGGVDVGAELRQLWQRTEAAADRSAEYLAAGWEKYRTDDPLKSELIEAKLHLTNARIDVFTGHQAAQATEELRLAEQSLGQASATAQEQDSDAGYQKQIIALQRALGELRSDPAAVGETRYSGLQQQLHRMIGTL
jgi:hypothetical protein